jgi:hypothetical protein
MKMLMILCPSSRLEHVQKLVDGHDVHGYTEILEVRGAGISGKHLGTRAWPGTSALFRLFLGVELSAAAQDWRRWHGGGLEGRAAAAGAPDCTLRPPSSIKCTRSGPVGWYGECREPTRVRESTHRDDCRSKE